MFHPQTEQSLADLKEGKLVVECVCTLTVVQVSAGAPSQNGFLICRIFDSLHFT